MSEFEIPRSSARLALKSGRWLGLALAAFGLFDGFPVWLRLGPATTGSTGSLANAQTPQAEIDMAALAAVPAIATECPPIKVRAGGEAHLLLQEQQGRRRPVR